MIKDETLICDYCKGETGLFDPDSGNHVTCELENTRTELEKLRAVTTSARAYIDACVKAAETKEWDDMSATEKEYNALAAALKELEK